MCVFQILKRDYLSTLRSHFKTLAQQLESHPHRPPHDEIVQGDLKLRKSFTSKVPKPLLSNLAKQKIVLTGDFLGFGFEAWLKTFAPERLHRFWKRMASVEDGKGGTRKLDELQARNLIAEGKHLFASFFVFTVFQQGRRFNQWEVDLCLELKHRGLSREGIEVLSSAGRILPLRSFDLHRNRRLETVFERIR